MNEIEFNIKIKVLFSLILLDTIETERSILLVMKYVLDGVLLIIINIRIKQQENIPILKL